MVEPQTCALHNEMWGELKKTMGEILDELKATRKIQASRQCGENIIRISNLEQDVKDGKDDSIRQWAAIDQIKRHIYLAMGGIGAISVILNFLIAIWGKS